jgi:hypothetical protein
MRRMQGSVKFVTMQTSATDVTGYIESKKAIALCPRCDRFYL